MGANIFSISGPTRFIKSFQKEKQSKLFANMSISCWSVCIVIWSMVDIWCVACSSFVSSADDGQKTHNEHNKEGPALRKRWLLGLIYNYEHLLNAVDSSQYLTVCHATCLSFVRTRVGSHWCWKKKWNRNLQSAHAFWLPSVESVFLESRFARATTSEIWLLVTTVLGFTKTRRSIEED